MRVKLKRTVAAFLSVLVAFSMLVSGQAPMLVKAGAEAGSLRFTCQDHAIEGGSIYYKLDNADSFTMVSEEGDQYASINVSTASAITIKFVAKSGYQLDTGRGVTVRANETVPYAETGDAVAGFVDENGVELNLASWVGEGNVANSNFEL